jgi:hypothetical protein
MRFYPVVLSEVPCKRQGGHSAGSGGGWWEIAIGVAGVPLAGETRLSQNTTQRMTKSSPKSESPAPTIRVSVTFQSAGSTRPLGFRPIASNSSLHRAILYGQIACGGPKTRLKIPRTTISREHMLVSMRGRSYNSSSHRPGLVVHSKRVSRDHRPAALGRISRGRWFGSPVPRAVGDSIAAEPAQPRSPTCW